MELRHLRYLVGVADAGTFVHAAQALRVAQPALSRQIKDLEKECQVPLFEPGASRATLTPGGAVGAVLARALIRDAERAVRRTRLSESGLAGQCTLAPGPIAVLSGFVATLIARVRRKFPGIQLAVKEVGGRQQWETVARGHADIGLGVAPSLQFSTLLHELQVPDKVDVALMSPGHPLADRASVSLQELREYRLIALEDMDSTPDTVKELLQGGRRKEEPAEIATLEVAGVEALIAHTRAGHGWSFCPRNMSRLYAPLIGVPITDFEAPYDTMRIWRRAEIRPSVHTVLQELRLMQSEAQGAATPESLPTPGNSEAIVERLPRLELRQLRSFAAVVQHGSFGRAAEVLNISQPGLSRQIRILEADVGVRLFDRRNRGVELTPAGETFKGEVMNLLAGVDRFSKEVRRAERGRTGQCVMGVVPHVHIDRIVSETMRRLGSGDARVRMGARALTTPQLGEALRRSEIDVAIAYAYPMPVAQMDGLVRQSLFRDEMRCALVSATHPLAARDCLTLADLRDVPFLFPRRSVLPRLYDAVMQKFSVAGVTPNVDAEYDGVLTIWSLVANGFGWSVGTAVQLNEPPLGTRCVPLADFSLSWGGEVVYREDESRRSVLDVIDTVIAAARSLRVPLVAA